MNDEQVRNELNKAATNLGMELSQMEQKYAEIAEQNGIDDSLITMNLFRQWYSGVSKKTNSGEEPKINSGGKKPNERTFFGYIVASEEARDFEQYNRDQLTAAIIRDSNAAFNEGKYARVVETESGYEISQVMNNEVVTRPLQNTVLPESVMDVNGQLVVPVDDRKELPWKNDKGTFDNEAYGHPKDKHNWRRNIHLIGSVDGGEIQYWSLGAKNDAAQDWDVDMQRGVYIDCWARDGDLDGGKLFGPKLDTVVYNDELENPQPMSSNMQTLVAENMRGFVCPLVNLEGYHQSNKGRPARERMVITDGSVTNMYMNPNSNGNRTLYVSDVNADFDYDNPTSATPCWVPEHVELDFGIGSQILIIGRTNQSTNQETGELRQCSINVFGVIVLNRMGSPNTTQDSGETYTGWF